MLYNIWTSKLTCLLRCQDFPSLDQLKQQFSDKVNQEPYHHLFKDGFVKNVVPDPDVPPNCDTDSSEYGPVQWIDKFMKHLFSYFFTLFNSFPIHILEWKIEDYAVDNNDGLLIGLISDLERSLNLAPEIKMKQWLAYCQIFHWKD